MSPRGPGGSPRELVPGDPGGVEALAGRLRAYAEGAAAGAARLRAIDSGAWEGEAADAFRAVIDEIPSKLERGAGAFAEAADALGAYAATLRSAQEVATRVVGLLGEADQHSAAWSFQREAYTAALGQGEAVAATLGPPPSVMDPEAAQRQEALRLLEGARVEVDSAARRSAARLRDAAAVAPDEPGLLSKIWHGVSEFGAGAWEATYGMARFAFTLSPLYLVVDPEGYVENLVGLGQGVVYGVTHPVEFAKAVSDWDTWVENPARALGHLVPTLLLTLASGGAASAGKAGQGLLATAARSQARRLLTSAAKEEPAVTKALGEIAQRGQARLVGLENRLKSEASLARKIEQRAGARHGLPLDEAVRLEADEVHDALRYTMESDKERYMSAYELSRAELEGRGFTLEKAANSWAKPGSPEAGPYRGINTQWRTETGQPFEVQFHTPESYAAKSALHELYEESRAASTPVERKAELEEIMTRRADEIPVPRGAIP